MRKPDYRCVYNGQIFSVSSIDILHESINLCGADIINFDQGKLLDYTGVNDTKGKKIYNGDVIEFNYRDCIEPKICYVEYSETYAQYVIRSKEIYFDNEPLSDILNYNSEGLKIIGNINIKNDYFDKPEESEANSLESLDIDISMAITDAKRISTQLSNKAPELIDSINSILKKLIDIIIKEFEIIKRKDTNDESRKSNRTS